MRKNFIFLDMGFYSDCNLRCKYCREEYFINTCKYNIDRFKEEINLCLKNFKIAVLKMSGYGEVTLWKDFPLALEYAASKFPAIQIITNGTFNDDIFDIIKKYKNLTLNFTIDGHLFCMNNLRATNISIHELMLRNLNKAFQNNMNIEINCVLHERNISQFDQYLEYIYKNKGDSNVMVFPFPVKPFDKSPDYALKIKGDTEKFIDIIEKNYLKYKEILPPYEYFVDLFSFYRKGYRDSKCFVHWANIGSGSKDERLLCPNYGESLSFGDFLEAFKKLENIENTNNNLLKRNIGDGCKKCFNHYNVINNYFKNQISTDEIMRLPTLNHKGCKRILKAVKKEFIKIGY